MKKISYLVIVFLVFSSANLNLNAQHLVGFAPLSLVNGIKLKYETPVAEYISAGSFLKARLWGVNLFDEDEKIKGARLTPFLRYYFKENFHGVYGQATVIVGQISYIDSYSSESFGEYGFGAGVGWQYKFTRNKKWTLDFGLGLQAAFANDGRFFNSLGRIFDGHFSVCYVL